MIRPLPHHNPGRENLSYPKYGQFGFEEPVGRRHLRNKLSAIHKIIFNEEAESITRDAYNQVKMNLQGSFLDYSPQKSSSMEMPLKSYGGDSRVYQDSQQNKTKNYEKDQRTPKDLNSNTAMSYNIIQNQYSERYRPSNNKIQKRQDSLDSILNPYKSKPFKREFSIQPNVPNTSDLLQTDKNESKDLASSYNRELSLRYSIDSIEHHRKKNPTFLNSIL